MLTAVLFIDAVVLTGLSSAKIKDDAERLDRVEARLAARGIRVVDRVVERRGVFDGG